MASTAALDIVADDESGLKSQGHKSKLVWDKKQKKFVKQGQIGSDNKKYMKSESGALIRASYKTKAFE
jgi:ATP-dependent RNA helicase DDX54/DBP10